MLHSFSSNTAGYDACNTAEERNTYKNEAWESLLASGLIYNSDWTHTQLLVDRMNAQYMIEHLPYNQRDTYLKPLESAKRTLNRHKSDKGRNPNTGGKQAMVTNTGNNNNNSSVTNNKTSGSNFLQSGSRKCFVCGAANHVAPACPHRFKP